jgi:hypothetical protein
MEEIIEQEEEWDDDFEDDSSLEFFKPQAKGFFQLLFESFKYLTIKLPSIAIIVIPVFFVVEFLVPYLVEAFVKEITGDITGWEWVDKGILYWVNKMIMIGVEALFAAIIGGIAWIALIRVIAASMHGENLPPIQALKDGISMLPMFIVTAIIFYSLLIIGLVFLIIPGIILAIWFAFWEFSFVLRGHGAMSALMYSKKLVDDNFVRVSLNIIGITIIMLILNYYAIDLIANKIAIQVDADEGLLYTSINAILGASGRLFEGLRIIFLMTLFMDLENKK